MTVLLTLRAPGWGSSGASADLGLSWGRELGVRTLALHVFGSRCPELCQNYGDAHSLHPGSLINNASGSLASRKCFIYLTKATQRKLQHMTSHVINQFDVRFVCKTGVTAPPDSILRMGGIEDPQYARVFSCQSLNQT
ncbi:hypothetical protein NDU88_006021 [Pleurodeles waltl]|uniref:Uncharacterized protein n=1 Tax=Pleurodeles waltl TaxID=8319 RepID=A0AAV7SNJ4_PLEWA|nr:hypothetical protein NDU88_006021 [Pleurodeles waltl]